MIHGRSLIAQSVFWLCFACSSSVFAEELKVVGFNVESGGADASVIAQENIAPLEKVDLWGLSEVQDASWAEVFESAAAEGETGQFKYILGSTGGSDRLAIVYNSDRLEFLSQEELNDLNIGGRVRAPLVAKFRLKSTGQEFLFIVNHLYRGNEEARHQQAILLKSMGTHSATANYCGGRLQF